MLFRLLPGRRIDDTIAVIIRSSNYLSWGDIAVDSTVTPRVLRVRMKQSKTDKLRHGVDVFVGRTGCSLCPVAAVLAYMAIRGSQMGPFLKFVDDKPLTKDSFTRKTREALQAVGLPYQDFAGHSFRIGAATAAARAGVEDSTIRMMGRWSSSAFLSYIRTPRDQLASFSRNLAQT